MSAFGIRKSKPDKRWSSGGSLAPTGDVGGDYAGSTALRSPASLDAEDKASALGLGLTPVALGSELSGSIHGFVYEVSQGPVARRKIRVTIVLSARPNSATKWWINQYNSDAKRTLSYEPQNNGLPKL